MKYKDVGRSSRTPFKHEMLNAVAGKCVGSWLTGRIPFISGHWRIVDMTAGDGGAEGQNSSPKILIKHAESIINGIKPFPMRGTVKLTLIEKQEASFETLKASIETNPWIEIVNQDAKDYVIRPDRSDQPWIVYADPNKITELPLTETMFNSLPKYSILGITLGCNVGGLKRLPPIERIKWYNIPAMLHQSLPSWHDLILIWLNGDASQWAYIFRVPEVWVNPLLSDFRSKSRKYNSYGMGFASFRRTPQQWQEALDYLFLTAKERSTNEHAESII